MTQRIIIQQFPIVVVQGSYDWDSSTPTSIDLLHMIKEINSNWQSNCRPSNDITIHEIIFLYVTRENKFHMKINNMLE